MVSTVPLYLAFLAAVGLERVGELFLSARNARLALERGGREAGRGHFPVMAALHTLFLGSCAVEVVALHRPFPFALGLSALGVALGAQVLRYWAIFTLKERWNTRIIVLPGSVPVTAGPYRFLRHPNYVAVILEMAALPLVHGAWLTAVVFSVANGALLYVRIRAEERALGEPYAQAFSSVPRFIPHAKEARHGHVR